MGGVGEGCRKKLRVGMLDWLMGCRQVECTVDFRMLGQNDK